MSLWAAVLVLGCAATGCGGQILPELQYSVDGTPYGEPEGLVTLGNFEDARPNGEIAGYHPSGGFLGTQVTSYVIREGAAAKWIEEALSQELGARGLAVISAPGAMYGGWTLNGRILQTRYSHTMFVRKALLGLSLELRKDGHLVLKQSYARMGEASLWTTSHSRACGEAFGEALKVLLDHALPSFVGAIKGETP